MKLTILGSGTAVIRKKRKSACYLLEVGAAKNGQASSKKLLLFDCGTGITNITNTSYDVQKIDHIFISHPHVDHLGGLMNLLQSMLVSGMYYPKTKRSKPLYLHGYQGFKKDYEALRKILFPEREEPYEIKILESGRATAQNIPHGTAKKFGNFTVTTSEIKHNPHLFHANSYRIETGGKRFVYSGDCGFDERLIQLSSNADLALYEMSNSPQKFKKFGPTPNHLSPYECGLIAARANVKKLALVHWYDDTPKSEILKDVRKNFQGEVSIPADLEVIKI